MKNAYHLLLCVCCISLVSCQKDITEEQVKQPAAATPQTSTDPLWLGEQAALRKAIESGAIELAAPGDSILPVVTPAPETRHTFATKDTRNWMSRISGKAPIQSLSIPGTHDSAADNKNHGNLQQHSITQQLEWGVRVFDIRCRHVDNWLLIHHGVYYQNKSFGNVMDEINNFLNKYPSETVLMIVQEEHTPAGATRTFNESFDWYMGQQRWRDKIWRGRWLPDNLDAARGKIIPIVRFDNFGYVPVYWEDNCTFTSWGNVPMRIQDSYWITRAQWMPWKWAQINAMLEEAKNSTDNNMLYINFLSGGSSGLLPWDCAHGCVGYRGMNEAFYRYCDGKKLVQRMGCIMMDFIRDDYHSNNIINSNKTPQGEVWVNSEETKNESATGYNAIDGNPNTYWHTQYTGNYWWPGYACISIQLPSAHKYKGVILQHRQNTYDGRPCSFKVEYEQANGALTPVLISGQTANNQGSEWGRLASNQNGAQRFYFSKDYTTNTFRITFKDIVGNRSHTFMSEIYFFE